MSRPKSKLEREEKSKKLKGTGGASTINLVKPRSFTNPPDSITPTRTAQQWPVFSCIAVSTNWPYNIGEKRKVCLCEEPSGAIFGRGCEASHDFVATNCAYRLVLRHKVHRPLRKLTVGGPANVPFDPLSNA